MFGGIEAWERGDAAVTELVSVVATSFTPDYAGRHISQEHSFAAAPDVAASAD